MIDGEISARSGGNGSHGGSGGAVRVVCDRLLGNGIITTQLDALVGAGRIRLESNHFSGSLVTVPGASLETAGSKPFISDFFNGTSPELITQPTLWVQSIGGQAVPSDPRASMSLPGADVSISNTEPVEVVLGSLRLPAEATVEIRVAGRYTDSFTVQATRTTPPMPGPVPLYEWSAMVTFPADYTSIRAIATGP